MHKSDDRPGEDVPVAVELADGDPGNQSTVASVPAGSVGAGVVVSTR